MKYQHDDVFLIFFRQAFFSYALQKLPSIRQEYIQSSSTLQSVHKIQHVLICVSASIFSFLGHFKMDKMLRYYAIYVQFIIIHYTYRLWGIFMFICCLNILFISVKSQSDRSIDSLLNQFLGFFL